ncbi:kinase-like domain-containing protein [Choanephora cucurbitarum]|nr:kinase-like domain-containing protein [Choanephora cucurbitarum]
MTITQRTTEIAGLLTLKGLPHMGQITHVLKEDHGEIIGLCMERYQKTLKQYTHAHSHHRLTAYQKMDLILQMLESIATLHRAGLAHRDLSEVNFMVNQTDYKLRDGSPKASLYLIDFGKSTFTSPDVYRCWWVEQPRLDIQGYDDEIIPRTKEELDVWCRRLPWVPSKPDHGYKLYRSIQTLPKSRSDTEGLAWLVNPVAEDLYSIGTLIWKTFAETEPWYGIMDSDIKALRDIVSDDYRLQKTLEREVRGHLSRELLLKFLKVSPQQRESAESVLTWLSDEAIQNGLIAEWERNAPVARQKRHAKALSAHDEEQAVEFSHFQRKRHKTGYTEADT